MTSPSTRSCANCATWTQSSCRMRCSGRRRRCSGWSPRTRRNVVGFALYFLNFSTWEGVHGIYLEDLYVRPDQRGSGLGRALLTGLADIADERGYARVEWSVLDWNAPSIEFYRSLGADPMDELDDRSGSLVRLCERQRKSVDPGVRRPADQQIPGHPRPPAPAPYPSRTARSARSARCRPNTSTPGPPDTACGPSAGRGALRWRRPPAARQHQVVGGLGQRAADRHALGQSRRPGSPRPASAARHLQQDQDSRDRPPAAAAGC